MNYEYYKSNYDKLTKQERNSNKEFRTKFLEEAQQAALEELKKDMNSRLQEVLIKRRK